MESTAVHELRVDSRNNVFVMAALHASGRAVIPVRVRNISRTGALLEAAALPSAGTAVRLNRASLTAQGMVVWTAGNKAGVQFDLPVAVADWLPQGRRGVGQQFVDELFHQKRLGIAPKREERPQASGFGFTEELMQLRSLLESAAEELAISGTVATRHTVALQAIDGVAQALARLAQEATTRGVAAGSA